MKERRVTLGDNEPERGTLAWAVMMRDELRTAMGDARYNMQVAQGIFRQLQEHGGWQHLRSAKRQPFRSFDHFCSDPNGFGMERFEIERRLTAHEMARPDGVLPLAPHGGDRTEQVDHINLNKGGTSSAYLVARLKRDHPDIAERLAAQEFPSARAAAIEAGIIRPPSPIALVRRAWKHATPEERDTIRAWIDEQ
jgi:hypothetical protein